jgi:hypothetical protein
MAKRKICSPTSNRTPLFSTAHKYTSTHLGAPTRMLVFSVLMSLFFVWFYSSFFYSMKLHLCRRMRNTVREVGGHGLYQGRDPNWVCPVTYRINQAAFLPHLLILQNHTQSISFRVSGNMQEGASGWFEIQLRCFFFKDGSDPASRYTI